MMSKLPKMKKKPRAIDLHGVQTDPRATALEEFIEFAQLQEAEDNLGYAVVEAMEKEGGSFVQALARMWRTGDQNNRRKVEETWPEYFAEYALALPEMDQEKDKFGRQAHPWLDDIPWRKKYHEAKRKYLPKRKHT